MNDGKDLERLVAIIQEACKTRPETVIYQNYLIDNTAGRKREIDILITSKVSDFEVNIAIECKDYKGKIPVEKVEAFNSKCLRIKGLHKKVMVSSKGFQADAIEAAREFDIDLLELRNVLEDEVLDWISLDSIKGIGKPRTQIEIAGGIAINWNAEDAHLLPEIDWNLMIYSDQDDEAKPLEDLTITEINENLDKLESLAMMKFIESKGHFPFVLETPCEITFPKHFYTKTKDNRKCYIRKISLNAITTIDEVEISKDVKKYQDQALSKSKAELITIKHNAGNQIHLVNLAGNEDAQIFYTDKDGKQIKLQTLSRYDPKTDRWEFY